MTNLKRVNFVIGFDQQGKPMSLGFSETEFREIYFTDDARYVRMDNFKPDSTEVISVLYPVDKYYAIEYQTSEKFNIKPVTFKAEGAGLDVA